MVTIQVHFIWQKSLKVLGAQYALDDKISDYGIVSWDTIEKDVYKVEGLIEKLNRSIAPSNLAVSGRYIRTLDHFEALENTS